MKDCFGREINYMRISVTDLCNLRCEYCMPEEGTKKLKHSDILSFEETVDIVRAAAELGINKIRITGGEPLVKPDIVDLCQKISSVPGINEVSMTTNGVLLDKMAKDLKAAGINRINISLDTLDPQKYKRITRIGELSDALTGIKAAEAAGMYPIKINTVLIGGFNDDEIEEFVELTRERDIEQRFIELMPIGEGAQFPDEAYISADIVLQRVCELEPCSEDGGVARLYKLPNGEGKVGLITPVSNHFCHDCNRIRLTADGKIKPCLLSAQEVSIKGLDKEDLKLAIMHAIYDKPIQHEALSSAFPSKAGRKMNQIGG